MSDLILHHYPVSPFAGNVVVHFPRFGYQIVKPAG
jgi:hypothetical protein